MIAVSGLSLLGRIAGSQSGPMDVMEDPEAAGAESLALAEVWQYGAEVRRLAGHLCQHREDAEDVAQNTLMKAASHLLGFRHEASMRTWLHRIATNECRQLRRRTPPVSLDRLLESTWHDDASAIGQLQVTDPEEAAIEAEMRNAVLASLEELPAGERTVLLMRDGQGLGIPEIGAATGSSELAVRSRLYRARHHLRDRLARRLGSGDRTQAATKEPPAHL